jgi:hypothetical protein
MQHDAASHSGAASHFSEDDPNLVNCQPLAIAPARSIFCADRVLRQSENSSQNANREEVVAFLAGWEELEASRRANANSSGTIVGVYFNFEMRSRIPANAGPPKLFYMTFWMSLTRRLIQQVGTTSKT